MKYMILFILAFLLLPKSSPAQIPDTPEFKTFIITKARHRYPGNPDPVLLNIKGNSAAEISTIHCASRISKDRNIRIAPLLITHVHKDDPFGNFATEEDLNTGR